MAKDIVTRLRDAEDNGICEWQVLSDAADEIERLREINRNLHTECDRMNAERRA